MGLRVCVCVCLAGPAKPTRQASAKLYQRRVFSRTTSNETEAASGIIRPSRRTPSQQSPVGSKERGGAVVEEAAGTAAKRRDRREDPLRRSGLTQDAFGAQEQTVGA